MLALTLHGRTEYLPEADQEAAMSRYWSARQAGDVTANLRRVPDLPPDDPDPDDDPPPGGVAAGEGSSPQLLATVPGAISPIAVQRIALHEQWLAEAGFSVPPPLFAAGTRVLPLGDRNFRTERRRVEALPRFPDASRLVRQAIEAEERQDRTVRFGDIAMDDSGRLLIDAEPSMGLALPAFRQLASLAGFGAGVRYLAEMCDAQLRGENVTWQLRNRSEPDKEVVLRTRSDGAGHRHAFAVVTPSYAAVDTHEVLAAVDSELTEAHTEIRYDGTGVRATALFLPDQIVDLAAGDVFKAGVRISTDDTGRGRIRISAVVFRNRCLNLLIIGEGEVETLNQVHRGDPSRILGLLQGAVTQALGKIEHFLDAWGHARTVHLDPEETLRRWVQTGQIKPPSPSDAKATVEALFSTWRKEPGDTLADCVNAVTRAAHEAPLWGVDAREEMERQAAQLVYAAA